MKITITREAYESLHKGVLPGETLGKPKAFLLDGRVIIEIDPETNERLRQVAFPNETISDTIIRLVAFFCGKAN